MDSKGSHKHCYAAICHPALKDAIAVHNVSILKLALLVSEFAQQMAAAHELFSKEVQSIISTFRRRGFELKKQRPVDTPSSIFKAWEALLAETELDAQAHLDAASLLVKNVYMPLQEVASHKNRQADMLSSFRDDFESLLHTAMRDLQKTESSYHQSYKEYADVANPEGEALDEVRARLHNCHNNYILNIRASNRTTDGYKKALPQILEELEGIYIDTSNTINVALESHALMLLTKANEQHRRYEGQLRTCKQVSPKQDVTLFVKATSLDSPSPLAVQVTSYAFKAPVSVAADNQKSLCRQLIVDRLTEKQVHQRKALLQTQGMELAVNMQQTQDLSNTLTNVCQRFDVQIFGAPTYGHAGAPGSVQPTREPSFSYIGTRPIATYS